MEYFNFPLTIIAFILYKMFFRLFSNAASIQVCSGASVITPDPEFIAKLQTTATQEEKVEELNDSLDEDMEIVCSVTTKNESG